MTTGMVVTSMHIWREGGIVGITRLATITDEILIQQIQEQLTLVPTARPPRLPDMFQYVFEVRGGGQDSGFRAERHLPENALPPALRDLLRQVTFESSAKTG